MLAAYERSVANHPWLTAMVTGSVVGGAGDVVSQLVIEKRQTVDLRRLARTLLHRGLFGAFMRAYYLRLEQVSFLKGRSPMVKLLFNELIGSWVVNAYFLISYAAISGQDHVKALQLTPKVVKAGLMVWPIANLISFNYVPVNLRSLYANVIGFFWGIFMSSQQARRK